MALIATFGRSVLAAETDKLNPDEVDVTIVVPEGCVKFTLASRTIICASADQKYVADVFAEIDRRRAAAKPAQELIARFAAKRELLATAVLKDLPSLTPSAVDRFFDTEIVPALKLATSPGSQQVWILLTEDVLKHALASGWRVPSLQYHALAGKVSVVDDWSRDVSHSQEYTYVPTRGSDGDSVSRLSSSADAVMAAEAQNASLREAKAVASAIGRFESFIALACPPSLATGVDKEWFSIGLRGALAARYVSLFHGDPARRFVDAMVTPVGDVAVRAADVDLLHPVPPSSLKPAFAAAHREAHRRKSIAIMHHWLGQIEAGKVGATLRALDRLTPEDGLTLAAIVRDTSGIDLAPLLRPIR